MLSSSSCFLKKKTNWKITLSSNDKQPYGAYLAYHALPYYFHGTQPINLSRWFQYTDIESKIPPNYTGATLLVLAGLDFYVSDEELQQLLRFVYDGNEVILFCSHLDNKLEKKLNCYKVGTGFEELRLSDYNDGSQNMGALSLSNMPGKQFGYKGRSLQSYLTNDTNAYKTLYHNGLPYRVRTLPLPDDTLGYVKGKPDFERYRIGEGHIYIHAAPLVLSNYFLLQPENRKYMDGLLQALPKDINAIYWSSYFKRTPEGNNKSVLLRYPSTKWALIIALFTMLMFILFETKRRQRIIPIIEPTKNTSVSFVETVGRLYYNKSNHRNLAEKMVQHFLEWIRTHYFLNTNLLNEDFIRQLTVKSGQPEETVRKLIGQIHEIRLNETNLTEEYLYTLYTTIQQFYKTHNNGSY